MSSLTNDNIAKIQALYKKLLHFKQSPLYNYRTENKYKPVLGEGSVNAKIIFVGEAPGKNEALTGKPFSGSAGKFLDQLLTSINLKRDEVYITNIINDRPPENRDPLPKEIALYSPLLDELINIIQPRIIATLGRFSMKYILEKFHSEYATEPISQLHGKVIHATAPYGKIIIIPLYHPAVALYNAKSRQTLFSDFKNIQSLL